MYSVLFICTANICRSPMAEGLLRLRVLDEAAQWAISSAGVWALPGYPAAPNTLAVLQARGIDLRDHRSRVITREVVAEHCLVLTMERGQKEALRLAFPEYADRVLLFYELVGRFEEVVDPIGLSIKDFEETAQELETVFDQSLEKIRQLAAGYGYGQNQ